MKTLLAYRNTDGNIVMAEPMNICAVTLVTQQAKARLLINSNDMPAPSSQPVLAVIFNNM